MKKRKTPHITRLTFAMDSFGSKATTTDIFSRTLTLSIYGKDLFMGIFSKVITTDTFSRTLTMGISGKTLTLGIYGKDLPMDIFSEAIT